MPEMLEPENSRPNPEQLAWSDPIKLASIIIANEGGFEYVPQDQNRGVVRHIHGWKTPDGGQYTLRSAHPRNTAATYWLLVTDADAQTTHYSLNGSRGGVYLVNEYLNSATPGRDQDIFTQELQDQMNHSVARLLRTVPSRRVQREISPGYKPGGIGQSILEVAQDTFLPKRLPQTSINPAGTYAQAREIIGFLDAETNIVQLVMSGARIGKINKHISAWNRTRPEYTDRQIRQALTRHVMDGPLLTLDTTRANKAA